MGAQLKNSLNEDEFNAFKSLFLTFGIEWKDCKNKNVVKVIKKQYYKLSKEFHPDKNVNVTKNQDQNKKKIREVNHVKEVLYKFITEPLEKGLSKKDNLARCLHNELWKYNYQELQRYLSERGAKKLKEKELSVMNNVATYSKYSFGLFLLGGILQFSSSIAFFIGNGITYNVPIALGFFAPLLAQFIVKSAIKSIYTQNGKEFNQDTSTSLLFNFDQECENFSKSDRTKLKWLKNSIILSNIIFTSLMFYGVGLDLVANGFGITNSVLLSGLLLSLPFTLLIVASPVLNAASNYILKKTAIDLIEEKFKGDDQFIEVNNEQPNSTVSNQNYLPISQLMLTYH